jgi:ferredoxin
VSYPVLKSIVVLLAMLVAAWLFGRRAYELLWRNLRRGQASNAFANPGKRVKSVIVYVGGQLRLFRFLVPGTSHFFVFWGFLILFPTILLAMIEGLFAFAWPEHGLAFMKYLGPLALLQDLFAVFVIVAVVYDMYLRMVVNPERYEGSHRRQGVMVLMFIFTIMASLLVINGIRINLGVEPLAAWRPVSAAVGQLFAGLSKGTQIAIEEFAYWVHLLIVLVFLVELPGGKHFHVITSIPAVFLRNLDPRGRLPAAPEFDSDVGVSTVDHFTWRQMLDFYTCTECGRCQDVCPAYGSGLPLSPKLLIMGLRDNLIAVGDAAESNGAATAEPPPLIGDAVTQEALWACTTCYACDQECPLFIEHVTPIVDMRRHLVIEGDMDDMPRRTPPLSTSRTTRRSSRPTPTATTRCCTSTLLRTAAGGACCTTASCSTNSSRRGSCACRMHCNVPSRTMIRATWVVTTTCTMRHAE